MCVSHGGDWIGLNRVVLDNAGRCRNVIGWMVKMNWVSLTSRVAGRICRVVDARRSEEEEHEEAERKSENVIGARLWNENVREAQGNRVGGGGWRGSKAYRIRLSRSRREQDFLLV